MRTRKNRKKSLPNRQAFRAGARAGSHGFLVTVGPFLLGFLLLGVGISIRAQRSVSAPPPLPTLDEIDHELARQFRAFSSAAAAQPSDPDRHGELEILYEAHGYRRLARACYENAVAADESRVRWHHHAGLVALAEGDLERAEQAFRFVIRYVPDYIPAYERLAYLRLERGRSPRPVISLRQWSI